MLTSESTIITGLKSGGPQRSKYETDLYKTFHYFIKQGMLKYRLSEEDAASAYSDTIISIIDNVVTNRFEGRSSLKSYAYQIFMNRCVDLVRKETTNKKKVHHTTSLDSLVIELPERTRNVIQELIIKNERFHLLEKLKEIGEKCRQLLLLFEDGYNDKEIAGIMQYHSADVVKTSRLRCIEKLKQKVMGSNRKHE